MQELEIGDTVTVTLTGKVVYVSLSSHNYVEVITDGAKSESAFRMDDPDVSVKVAEKVFPVGAVVRFRDSGNIYTVLPDDKVYGHGEGEAYLAATVTTEFYDHVAGPNAE